MPDPEPIRRDSMRGQILVGVDESPESVSALQWAGRLAGAVDADVHVAYAWFRRGQLAGMHATASEPGDLEAALERRLHQIAEDAGLPPQVEIIVHALRGMPAHALEMTADRLDADLVVVGASSRSTLSRIVRSSVSRSLLTRPRRPVAVIPRDAEPTSWHEGLVVVAVDESHSAARAVRWAAALARRTGVGVVAVHAFTPTPRDLSPSDEQQLFEETTNRLRQEWCAVLRDEGVDIDTHCRPGDPATVIQSLATSIPATCVVIGSSDTATLRNALFGGVSQRVGRNPAAPIVIVPSPNDRITW